MTDFSWTSKTLFYMTIYGFIALISDKIHFNYILAGGIILFVFVIELIVNNQ